MINTPSNTVIGGTGIWTSGATILGSSSQNLTQIIKSIFSVGGQGFAYDPNDLPTMFQDAAGTVPVTAVGQPIGLLLDKSRGLAVGTERLQSPFSDPSKWNLIAGFSLLNGKLICDGSQTSISAVFRTDGISFIPFRSYLVEVTLDSYSGSTPVFRANAGVGFTLRNVGKNIGIVTTYANGVNFNILAPVGTSFVISNISIKELEGNHAYQTTSASRPVLQRNATTGAYYLAFDGADDFLKTNSIDFTSTDKMSLFAGLERTGNANIGTVLETGVNYTAPTGGFGIQAPHGVGANSVNLMASSDGASGFTAGVNTPNVFTYTGFIDLSKMTAKDQVKIRVNGAYDTASRTNLAGNGNFANVPVYIGRRAGTSQPFNGRIYGLIGIGRLTTDVETAALEKFIAKNTGVTLNV